MTVGIEYCRMACVLPVMTLDSVPEETCLWNVIVVIVVGRKVSEGDEYCRMDFVLPVMTLVFASGETFL